MLLPDLLAGGRRVWHYSQLVVARALHCSCSAFLLSVVSGLLTCMIQEEQVGQRKGRAFKPKIGHRDHFTVLTYLEVSPYFLVPGIFFAACTTHSTRMQQRSFQNRESVAMTGNGSQPPINTKLSPWQYTTGLRHASRYGPLLLVLLQ